MAGVQAICPVHGLYEETRLFDVAGTGHATIVLNNVSVACPICGRQSKTIDGTYEFIGNILQAFREPGVTKDEIDALTDIIRKVANNELDAKNAKISASEIRSSFRQIIEFVEKYPVSASLVMWIITLIVTAYPSLDAKDASDRAHLDAQEIHSTQQKIYEEIKRRPLIEGPAELREPAKPAQKLKRQPRNQKSSGNPNRRDRRKAAKLARSRR